MSLPPSVQLGRNIRLGYHPIQRNPRGVSEGHDPRRNGKVELSTYYIYIYYMYVCMYIRMYICIYIYITKYHTYCPCFDFNIATDCNHLCHPSSSRLYADHWNALRISLRPRRMICCKGVCAYHVGQYLTRMRSDCKAAQKEASVAYSWSARVL